MGQLSKHINEVLKNGSYDPSQFSNNPEAYKEVNQNRKYFVNDDFILDDFFKLFIYSTGNSIKPPGTPFIIDDFNKNVIRQLYYYFINDSDNFDGELHKGIWLSGPYGTGKTIIMSAFITCVKKYFCEKRNDFNNTIKLFPIKDAASLRARDILSKKRNTYSGNESYLYKTSLPLFIDDIGKEQTEVNEYGTKIKPFETLINYRYDHYLLTFTTSNYKLNDVSYSGHCKDRMKAMFNEITLTGKGRRR